MSLSLFLSFLSQPLSLFLSLSLPPSLSLSLSRARSDILFLSYLKETTHWFFSIHIAAKMSSLQSANAIKPHPFTKILTKKDKTWIRRKNKIRKKKKKQIRFAYFLTEVTLLQKSLKSPGAANHWDRKFPAKHLIGAILCVVTGL